MNPEIIENARKLATELHRLHCHASDGENCTWDYESWESRNDGCEDYNEDQGHGTRIKYLNKAHKLLKCFDGITEVQKAIKCLRILNPKLTCQLIEEL